MGRPREHDEATRERLLAAAERLSAAKGFDAITVRAVAEEAATTTRAVYALFGSKEGLERALHHAMFTRLRDLEQGRRRRENPRDDLLELALAYRRWAVERPERYALAMHRFVGKGARPRSEEGLAVSREALDELVQAVHRCHDAGLLGAEAALTACGYTPKRILTGGGSDANAFHAKGFTVTNLANGTERNHETSERVSQIALEGMLDVTFALLDELAG